MISKDLIKKARQILHSEKAAFVPMGPGGPTQQGGPPPGMDPSGGMGGPPPGMDPSGGMGGPPPGGPPPGGDPSGGQPVQLQMQDLMQLVQMAAGGGGGAGGPPPDMDPSGGMGGPPPGMDPSGGPPPGGAPTPGADAAGTSGGKGKGKELSDIKASIDELKGQFHQLFAFLTGLQMQSPDGSGNQPPAIGAGVDPSQGPPPGGGGPPPAPPGGPGGPPPGMQVQASSSKKSRTLDTIIARLGGR